MQKRKWNQGFSLTETMVVVGLTGTIMVPSFMGTTDLITRTQKDVTHALEKQAIIDELKSWLSDSDNCSQASGAGGLRGIALDGTGPVSLTSGIGPNISGNYKFTPNTHFGQATTNTGKTLISAVELDDTCTVIGRSTSRFCISDLNITISQKKKVGLVLPTTHTIKITSQVDTSASRNIVTCTASGSGQQGRWESNSGGINFEDGSSSLFVGIGTDAPAYNLHVVGGDTQFEHGLDIGGNLNVGGSLSVSGNSTINPGSLTVNGNSTFNSTMGVSGATLFESSLSVTNSASLGGTLGVSGLASLNGQLTVAGNATLTGGSLSIGGNTSVSGVTTVSGQATLAGLTVSSGNLRFTSGTGTNRAIQNAPTISGSGWSISSGNFSATSFRAWSDRRLKKDIHPVEDALEKILKIRGTTYYFNTSEKLQSGVIAQDLVKAKMGELVGSFVRDGKTYLNVNYDGLHAYNIEAIKELDKKSQVQERKLNQLADFLCEEKHCREVIND